MRFDSHYYKLLIVLSMTMFICISFALCQPQMGIPMGPDEERLISSNTPLQPINHQSQAETEPTPPIRILDVSMTPNNCIEVLLNKFPSESWNRWKMFVDGQEWPMEGGSGNAIARPNAPILQATGILIGTDPWATGLGYIDFPCCGTIQFEIPGHGRTNECSFDLADKGCVTASNKFCGEGCTTDKNGNKVCIYPAEATKKSVQKPVLCIRDTKPSGSHLWIWDNNSWRDAGRVTPCCWPFPDSGNYEFKLTKPGYRDYQSDIYVNGHTDPGRIELVKNN